MATIKYMPFGVTDLFRKNIVAKELSKTGYTDMEGGFTEGVRDDFFKSGSDYIKARNPDLRSIAGGHDVYFHMYEILGTRHPEWEAYLWVHMELRLMLHKLFNPTKTLLHFPEPNKWLQDLMADRSKEVTFVNGLDFHIMERYIATDDVWKATNPQYKVIDQLDILEGTSSDKFDYIETQAALLFGADDNWQRAMWDMLNPGGIMVVLNTGGNKGMYRATVMLLHEYVEPNWDLKDLPNAEVLHFPIDAGFTILQKTA